MRFKCNQESLKAFCLIEICCTGNFSLHFLFFLDLSFCLFVCPTNHHQSYKRISMGFLEEQSMATLRLACRSQIAAVVSMTTDRCARRGCHWQRVTSSRAGGRLWLAVSCSSRRNVMTSSVDVSSATRCPQCLGDGDFSPASNLYTTTIARTTAAPKQRWSDIWPSLYPFIQLEPRCRIVFFFNASHNAEAHAS